MIQSQIYSLLSQRVDIAPNSALAVSAIAGQATINCKILAGGTLEIGGQSQTIGTMYPLGGAEVITIAASGKFWLYASGATVTIGIIRGMTDGV